MGFLPCSLPCHDSSLHKEKSDNYSHSNHHQLYSESSNSSLSSQPSLPSVPSLQLQQQQQQQQNISPSFRNQYDLVATLKSHSSYISSLVLAGKFLYSASSDGTIRLWARDCSSPATTSSYQSGNNSVVATNTAVKSVVVCGDKLFTAHQDHKIRVWGIESDKNDKADNIYKCIATLPTFNDRFATLFSSKNYVTVRRNKRRTWVHHNDAVSALAVSHDGSLLYSVSWDRTFKVWRVSDFKCLESVHNAHDDAVNAIALSSDGHVYTGSADKKIKAWYKPHGQKRHVLVATLEKHLSAVNALAVSGDGKVLYSGACDRSILVWERSDDDREGHAMVVVGALRGHSKAILCLAVAADLVCSGSADCSVRVWRRGVDKSYACLAVLEGHRRPVKCLTLAVAGGGGGENGGSDSRCSYLVYSGGLDCEIKVWKVWVPQL